MRPLKIALKVAGALVALVLVLFAGIAVFVQINKETIFSAITTQLNEHINGKLVIGQMKPSLIRGFPHISILLQDVLLQDSQWETHHRTLLEAKEIYVSVNALSVLSGSVHIRDINISKAKIIVYTDITGYSNASIFEKNKKKDTAEKKEQPRLNHINFTDVTFKLGNETKFKLFEFDIKKLKADMDYTARGWDAKVYIRTKVNNMMFNTAKGSFIKNKLLATELNISYDNSKETLLIPWQLLKLDKEKIQLMGKFVFAQSPGTFELFIKADGILYKNAIGMLTPSISSKIDMLDLKTPVDVQAILRGRTKYRDTPEVVVKWQVKNNTFSTPGGDIENCSFTGIFNNERVSGGGHNDPNALIEIKDMKGVWYGISFRADTVSITNLISPVLEGRFISSFDVTKLNPIIGGTSFHFDKGAVNVNVYYKGGIRNNDTTQPYIFGNINLANAAMTYVPRGLSFTNSSATLRFAGSDLYIDNVRIQRGATRLNMSGSLLNFMNLYYTAPEKIVLDWSLKSPMVNLNELIPLLAMRKPKAANPGNTAKKINRVSDQLDKVLDASSVRMKLQVDKVVYRKFEATQLNGLISMTSRDIILNELNLKHADGSMALNVHIKQEGNINNYTLDAATKRVNVKKFFSAFENFGQDAITDKNINGILSANIHVTGAVKDNGKMVPRAMNGTAAFKFEKGALINFEPFRVIGSLVFRKRNLDSIVFSTIENKFTIHGDKITIHPLYVESSAINMKVAGVYATNSTGTDINVDIPLRNPGKDELINSTELRHERNMKGITLHLKAKSGDDGKVKIVWNRKNTPAVIPTVRDLSIPVKKSKSKALPPIYPE